MNTTELIEIARDCKGVVIEQDNVYQADAGEIHFFCADDLQQFAQRIEQPHKQRIAELEKDCDILATNYDAARKRIAQLEQALQTSEALARAVMADHTGAA